MATTTRRRFLRTSTATAAGLTFVPSFLSAGVGRNPASDAITIGMIGCGKQATGLAYVLMQVPGTRLVAASDLHPAKLTKFIEGRSAHLTRADRAAEADITPYPDYRDLLAHDGLDAVVVAIPDHQHATVCIEALDRGLHVYCEKPLAHTVEEGRAMVEAVGRSGKVLQTGSMQRSMFNFGRAVELVQAGELGEVKEVLVAIGPPPKPFDLEAEKVPEGLDWSAWIGPSVMRPYHPSLLPPPDLDIWGKWRDYAEFGGGMVTDWGAHMFDIVQWAKGMDGSGPVRFVVPPGENSRDGLSCYYADGTRVGHRMFGRGNAIRFIGTEGSLDVSRGFLESTITGLIPEADQARQDQGAAFVKHFTNFVNVIREGGTLVCPVETGHRTSSLCTLANIAYRLGRPLEWDPATETITNDESANRLLGDAYRTSLAAVPRPR